MWPWWGKQGLNFLNYRMGITLEIILVWKIPLDRGAWRAIVHGVTKSQTQLRDWACIHTILEIRTHIEGVFLDDTSFLWEVPSLRVPFSTKGNTFFDQILSQGLELGFRHSQSHHTRKVNMPKLGPAFSCSQSKSRKLVSNIKEWGTGEQRHGGRCAGPSSLQSSCWRSASQIGFHEEWPHANIQLP